METTDVTIISFCNRFLTKNQRFLVAAFKPESTDKGKSPLANSLPVHFYLLAAATAKADKIRKHTTSISKRKHINIRVQARSFGSH